MHDIHQLFIRVLTATQEDSVVLQVNAKPQLLMKCMAAGEENRVACLVFLFCKTTKHCSKKKFL